MLDTYTTPLENELKRSWFAANVVDEQFPGEVREGVDSSAVIENKVDGGGRQIQQGYALR
jgi:hypothetical protein